MLLVQQTRVAVNAATVTINMSGTDVDSSGVTAKTLKPNGGTDSSGVTISICSMTISSGVWIIWGLPTNPFDV